jgi:hypothetical protein
MQDLIQHFHQILNMAVGEELIEGAEAHPITCLGELRIARITISSIHHWGKRMPRRIRQSGSALRKLIRSLAAAGLVEGS